MMQRYDISVKSTDALSVNMIKNIFSVGCTSTVVFYNIFEMLCVSFLLFANFTILGEAKHITDVSF